MGLRLMWAVAFLAWSRPPIRSVPWPYAGRQKSSSIDYPHHAGHPRRPALACPVRDPPRQIAVCLTPPARIRRPARTRVLGPPSDRLDHLAGLNGIGRRARRRARSRIRVRKSRIDMGPILHGAGVQPKPASCRGYACRRFAIVEPVSWTSN
jgi:hypothetical protein